MKKIIFLLLLLVYSIIISAQGIAFNGNGVAPDPSAILDVSSADKGILVPRMTSAQRTAIPVPAEGLLVYDIDTRNFWYFSGGWHEISGGFSLPYQAADADPSISFGINNISNSPGGVAIQGKRTLGGSGFTPPFSAGIWGDNSTGTGVIGTSVGHVGTFGLSAQNHGVYGQSNGESFAGVYGTHESYYGIGVMGLIENDGAAVYGLTNGDGGSAGLFKTISWDHNDTTFIASTNGTGVLAGFRINNTVTTSPAVDINHAGNGNGLKVSLTKPTSNVNAVDIQTLGLGSALSVATLKGRCAILTQNDANATDEAFRVSTNGKGSIAEFSKNNTTGLPNDPHDPAVFIDNTSKGVALKVNSLHAPSSKSGIEVQYDGQSSGIHVNSTSKGIFANSSDSQEAAIHTENSASGPAIRALSAITSSVEGTIIVSNTGGGNGIRADVTGGAYGTAIRGLSDSAYGSGVFGYTSGSGRGVNGVSIDDGIGVVGQAGASAANGLLSRAGVFTTHNPENTLACLTATHYGNGTPLLLESKYAFSYQPSMKILNNGFGNFATFYNDGVEKFFIESDGDIYTDGSIYVKENKGIVRNTYTSQLRVETVEVTVDIPGNGTYELFVPNEIMDIPLSFNTAFSSPPTVCLGNYLGGVNGDNLTPVINNVTNSGCTVTIKNLTSNNISVGDHGWKLMVIGVD